MCILMLWRDWDVGGFDFFCMMEGNTAGGCAGFGDPSSVGG